MDSTPSAEAIKRLAADHVSGAHALAGVAGDACIAAATTGDLLQLEAAVLAAVRAVPAMAPIVHVGAAALEGFAAHGAAGVERAVARARQMQARSLETLRASAAARILPGVRIVTHSASSAVRDVLQEAHRRGTRFSVTCLEARPLLEGVTLARALAESGIQVSVAIDAAMGIVVGEADLVLLGADSIAPRGLVHKVGTWPLCLTAGELGVPVLVLADPGKLLPALVRGALEGERPADEVHAGLGPDVRVTNRTFDLTPLELIDGVAVGDTLLDPDAVATRAGRVRLPGLLRAELDDVGDSA